MIKFRGKCAGVWRKGDHLTYANGDVIKAWNGSMSFEYSVDSKTVGQFTEMYDCDGKEIYEDDIIQNLRYENVIGRVIRHKGCWAMVFDNNDNDFVILYEDLQNFDYRVIGNVFDNPEIIKELEMQ